MNEDKIPLESPKMVRRPAENNEGDQHSSPTYLVGFVCVAVVDRGGGASDTGERRRP